MNPEELRSALEQAPRHKYNVAPAAERTADGILFASKGEMRRYLELRLLAKSGEIADLQLQVRFPLVVNSIKVATYVADFVYREPKTGETVIEDFKGYSSPMFKLKVKLMRALYHCIILETHADHSHSGGQPWKPRRRRKHRR